jgi:hypothetical protein
MGHCAPIWGRCDPIFPRPLASFELFLPGRAGCGQEIPRSEGRSAPAKPAKRRGRPSKAEIYPVDDKCAGCIRKTGCERVKHSQPATSAPAESQPQQEPRKRKAPMQPYVPGELRNCRKDSNEASRKTAKPPPVKESPIVAWLTGAAVKQAIAKATRKPCLGQVRGRYRAGRVSR